MALGQLAGGFRPLLTRYTGSGMPRRCFAAYVGCTKWAWNHLPVTLRQQRWGLAYGRHVNFLVRRDAKRGQSFATLFLRNRAELTLTLRLLEQRAKGSSLSITVLGCSKGAEVYSILWAIRSARPDLKVTVQAVDISQPILAFAELGIYSLATTSGPSPSTVEQKSSESEYVAINTNAQQTDWIFERLTDDEVGEIFEIEYGQAKVRPWLREGVTWRHGDAGDPRLLDAVGPQDIVVANRFLCHMAPATAEQGLLNVAGLVKPDGFLFVSGIDLDVRTAVAKRMGWLPVVDLIREVHEGDPSLTRGWPTGYWSLEPFHDRRVDWKFRYASVFRIGAAPQRRERIKDRQGC
jgi:chemotaxis methyl-accepting protein methylase